MPNVVPKWLFPEVDVVGSQGSHCGKRDVQLSNAEGNIEPCGDGCEFEVM